MKFSRKRERKKARETKPLPLHTPQHEKDIMENQIT
jgi:hypothetical protein